MTDNPQPSEDEPPLIDWQVTCPECGIDQITQRSQTRPSECFNCGSEAANIEPVHGRPSTSTHPAAGQYVTFPDHKFERHGREQTYLVWTELEFESDSSPVELRVDATTPDDAVERAVGREELTEVRRVLPEVRTVDVKIAGTTEEMDAIADGIESAGDLSDVLAANTPRVD